MNVSLITPTCNRSQAHAQALPKLQAQILDAFEILIVNNAVRLRVEALQADFNRTALRLTERRD